MQDILVRLNGFSQIPLDGLSHLAERGRQRTFPTGSVLIRQGEMGHCMYVILRGRVRVERVHPEIPDPIVLARLGPGDVVGEMGLLDGSPRSATVIALDDVVVAELTSTDLSETINRYPEVSGALLRLLTRRLRQTDELAAKMARQAREKQGS